MSSTEATKTPPPSSMAPEVPSESTEYPVSSPAPPAEPSASPSPPKEEAAASSPAPASVENAEQPHDDDAPTAISADAPQPTDAAPAPRKTRLLKDVEAEENRYIYETLYRSLDDATDTAIQDELTVGDTVRQARESKIEFLKATSLPLSEKMKGCAILARSLTDERNAQVAYVFILTSILILTLPLIMLTIGLHVVAPRLQVDATLCGGGMAVGTALILVIFYVVYAVREEMAEVRRTAEQETAEKKKK